MLLDTHALLWFALGDERLPQPAYDAMDVTSNEVLVSAASAWEIATEHRIGKLPQAEPFVRDWYGTLNRLKFRDLPVTAEYALRAGRLTIVNRDPFDRMILAQAIVEGAAAVSNERAWDAAGVTRVWA